MTDDTLITTTESPTLGAAPSPAPMLPGRLARIGILRPLSIRDFRLLWTGMTVSLLGDGFYMVAIAWQVYELSNAPTALSIVGFAWSLPMVAFLLIGGVASDRIDRRRVMIAADVARGLAVGIMGLLSVLGVLELWHVIALVTVFGVGEAFFGPAFNATVPVIVPSELLVQANSLDQFVRPAAVFMVGPALGGLAVAGLGAGSAFLFDAATFAVSAFAISLMRPLPIRQRDGDSTPWREIVEGFRFVRSETWLWATLLSALIAVFLFWGPFEVLVPFLIKNQLNGGARDVGLVFAMGGVGALIASFLMGQFGLPKRHITYMYLVWAVAIGSMVLFGLATNLESVLAARMLGGATGTAGMVVWGTLMHKLVPNELLGRVTSFDWFVSIGLVPVSFALTGPVAEAIGVDATFIWCGALGGLSTIAFLFIPGVRATEKDGRIHAN